MGHKVSSSRRRIIPEVIEAVAKLKVAGIPTVTFVTDVPESGRAASVGVDNFAAGATAAYLITNWAGSSGDVLLSLSHSSFRGEEERESGFLATLAQLAPGRQVRVVTDTDGLGRDDGSGGARSAEGESLDRCGVLHRRGQPRHPDRAQPSSASWNCRWARVRRVRSQLGLTAMSGHRDVDDRAAPSRDAACPRPSQPHFTAGLGHRTCECRRSCWASNAARNLPRSQPSSRACRSRSAWLWGAREPTGWSRSRLVGKA